MAFLSEGVKSTCQRRVLKILVFVLGCKNLTFFGQGGSQEKVCPRLRGVKLSI